MDKVFKELEKWLLSIMLLCLMGLAVLLIYVLLTTYPYEVFIGLVIFCVVAWFRYAFFE